MAASLVCGASTPPAPFTTNRHQSIARNVGKFYKLSASGTHMLFDHSDQVVQAVDSLSLNLLFTTPKQQSGANLVCPTIMKEMVITF